MLILTKKCCTFLCCPRTPRWDRTRGDWHPILQMDLKKLSLVVILLFQTFCSWLFVERGRF
ncbi:unnamed protein product [Moneuplotes crassus]|uniref:Uncharacterized protein n=1 Tax=Euplotes crassus TaxID=5936 RepID=A0AAD1UH57_EUPCR|nr:unnamed protein product [Moneuplotes crassus]